MKTTLTDVSNLAVGNTAAVNINANNTAIETAIENTLSRDGTAPNEMLSQLDMNSNRIINLPAANSPTEPARKAEVDAIIAGHVFAGTPGFIVSDGVNFASRTLTAGSGITITNPTGVGDPTIAVSAGSVTNAVLAVMANNTVKGNVSGGSSTPSDLTATQLTTLVNAFSSTLKGAVPASSGGTTNFLRADGSWVVPPSSAQFTTSTAGIVPSSGGGKLKYLRADGAWHDNFGYLSTDDFGCVGDGTTDDSAAFQTVLDALLVAGGGVVRVVGVLLLSNEFIVPCSNVAFFGRRNTRDGFTIKNGTALGNGLLQHTALSNISFDGLSFDGSLNLTEGVAGGTGFIQWYSDSTSVSTVKNFSVNNCVFKNSHSTYYISLVQQSPAVTVPQVIYNLNPMQFASITNCTFIADSALYASTNGGNSFIHTAGNTFTASNSDDGCIQDITVNNNRVYGYACEGFFMGLYNYHNVACTGNVLENMGNVSVASDFNYSFGFYASNPLCRRPYNITCSNNVMAGNHNNAVYAAGCRQVTVSNNVITGTSTSPVYPTLPHGFSLAFNGAQYLTCTGNLIIGGGGIYYGQDKSLASVDVIANNSIYVTTISGLTAIGILVNPDNTAASTDYNTTAIIANNNINADSSDGAGIVINPTYQCGRLFFINNTVKSQWIGLYCQSPILAKQLVFSGNTWCGTLANYSMLLLAGASPVFVQNDIIDYSQVTAGSSSGAFYTSTKLTIDGLILKDKTNTGAALNLVGAQGRIKNVSFPGCTTQVEASSLGLAKPVFSGTINDVVQNLAPTELGSGGFGTANQKYVIREWINLTGSTTWQDQRMLTGN